MKIFSSASARAKAGGLFREQTLNWVGVALLAHWQLESGMRAAVDAVAADYHKLHPNVREPLDP